MILKVGMGGGGVGLVKKQIILIKKRSWSKRYSKKGHEERMSKKLTKIMAVEILNSQCQLILICDLHLQ